MSVLYTKYKSNIKNNHKIREVVVDQQVNNSLWSEMKLIQGVLFVIFAVVSGKSFSIALLLYI